MARYDVVKGLDVITMAEGKQVGMGPEENPALTQENGE